MVSFDADTKDASGNGHDGTINGKVSLPRTVKETPMQPVISLAMKVPALLSHMMKHLSLIALRSMLGYIQIRPSTIMDVLCIREIWAPGLISWVSTIWLLPLHRAS